MRNTPKKIRNSMSDLLGISPLYKKMIDANLIFTHIPKAAGSSISQGLYGKNIGHFQISELKEVNPEKFSRCQTFTVLREPIERLYSSYNFARQGGTKYMPIYKPELYRRPEFKTFDSFVCDWLAIRSIDDLDPVFKSQFHYVRDGIDVFEYDFIGSTNNIGLVEAWCSEALNESVSFQKVNKTAYKKNNVRHVSNETISLLEKIYEKDFELFHSKFK